MATRTIPSDVQPVWICTVNGKKYRFPSGATVDVPDDVAALIDNINAGKEHPPAPYVPTLPAIGDGDEGKVIMVNGKRYVLAEAGGGGSATVDDALSDSSTNPVQNKVVKAALDAVNAPNEITGVINVENGAITLSNITAAELYAAAANGKLFKTTADYGGVTIELFGSVLAQKILDTYDFAMFDTAGRFMVTGHLNGTDAVVLAPVS